jgi:8-amino-7-oxononanoate synthase
VADNLLNDLQTELRQRAADGLIRKRRLLSSPQGAAIKADGREVLSFCSNDYLGLANQPELITAMQQAAEKSGVGSGASHFLSKCRRHYCFQPAIWRIWV